MLQSLVSLNGQVWCSLFTHPASNSYSIFLPRAFAGVWCHEFQRAWEDEKGVGRELGFSLQSSLRRLVDRQPWLSLKPGGGSGD